MFVYLDNSATTKPYREVAEDMGKVLMEDFGNPSSLHELGVKAEGRIKKARKEAGELLGVSPEELIFTSCGTESDNMALLSGCQARARRGKRVITTRVEHPAILETCKVLRDRGFEVVEIDVDSQGLVKLEELKDAVNEDTILISVMGVNNEVGTIQPIEEIGSFKESFNREHGREILFHTDAVQSFSKVEFDLRNVDMLSASAHKIHGPKGMGLLYMKKDLSIPAFINGGGQERKLRSGTENVAGIVGFGTACKLAKANYQERMDHINNLRKHLLSGLMVEIKDVMVNGPVETLGFDEKIPQGKAVACPAVLNLSFLGTRGEVILHTLETEGIYVSTGSACSSNKKGMSHVLKAMGRKDKEIEGAIRFSFSGENTLEEMDYVIEKAKAAVNRFRKLGSFR